MWSSRDWPRTDLLANRVAATPDAVALSEPHGGRPVTYRALDGDAKAVADRLDEQRADPADAPDRLRVGLPASNDADFVRLLCGIWRSGGIPVPLSPDDPADRIRHRLEHAGVEQLVHTAGGPTLPADDRPSVAVDPAGLAANTDDDTSRAAWDPDEVALILFTSGTTGESKGVTLTHRNLVASAVASAFRLGVTPTDRWLCCLPTTHMGGLAPIVRSILYGTTVVLQPSTDPASLSQAMESTDVTGISLVPTILRRLLDAEWDPPTALRFVLLGGAPASEPLLDRCDATGVPVYPTYGATETASQIATATPSDISGHPGTVGQPLLFAEVTIRHDGDPVPRGTVGEVVVDGPMVSPGYLDEQATAASFSDEGFATGDVGYRDESGRLWIQGRLDDAIQTGGETVHPTRVADVLRGHPAVADVSVVGLPDAEWGERVAALVVPTEAEIDIDALRDQCRTDLAPYEVPKTVKTATAVPRTASGTVDRAAVRRRLSD